MVLSNIEAALIAEQDATSAISQSSFFKTSKGDYGAHDVFVGIRVPTIRTIAKKFYAQSSLEDIEQLLQSPYNEYRLCGLLILVLKYAKAPNADTKIYKDFYCAHLYAVNNWNLVDSSAHTILGKYLYKCTDRSELYTLAKSPNLWENRVAIIATLTFIQNNDFADTLQLSELYFSHPHDLIHKAAGWMLREISKRDRACIEKFIRTHHAHMPRTMLRYAIERFDAATRLELLQL